MYELVGHDLAFEIPGYSLVLHALGDTLALTVQGDQQECEKKWCEKFHDCMNLGEGYLIFTTLKTVTVPSSVAMKWMKYNPGARSVTSI